MLRRTDRLSRTPSSGDRGEFERDRDRILYSAQFRRLGGVTQVTSPVELHSFHNRLTHSLEVAQIARRTAERLLRRDTSGSLTDYLHPDVCEAAALAHDLGHPPFGHNGELVLDRLAVTPSSVGGPCDPSGYEGNAQSLRILTKLAKHSVDYEGLNLTAATLRASIKYPWVRGPEGKEHEKFGAFPTERPLLDQLFDGLKPRAQTLEAQIMDLADDVAFSVHDLYDFITAGVIPLREIVGITGAELRQLLAQDKKAGECSDEAFENVVLNLATLPVTDIRTASRFSSDLVAGLKEWVSTNITRFTDTELSVEFQDDLPELKVSPEAGSEIIILKALTKYFVISSPALAVRQAGEAAILGKLYEVLLNDAVTASPALLSEEAKARLQVGNGPVRVVLDIISHMTDAQAIGLHHKLTGQSLASILDLTTPSLF